MIIAIVVILLIVIAIGYWGRGSTPVDEGLPPAGQPIAPSDQYPDNIPFSQPSGNSTGAPVGSIDVEISALLGAAAAEDQAMVNEVAEKAVLQADAQALMELGQNDYDNELR